MPAPRTVAQLLRDLEVVPESVLVIRNDTLVTRDEHSHDEDVVEIRPVISGGAHVKCRRCREPAVIDVRRHNAAFCHDCFLHHCREQVRRAIDDFDMIQPGERVLVAVSGGKDSLGLWHLLRELGYDADGLYVGLGIGEYSDTSGAVRARRSRRRTAGKLIEVDLPDDVRVRRSRRVAAPPSVRRARRAGCRSATSSTRPRSTHGYDVLATGHNLDDEAAVLFGNVLRWDTELPRPSASGAAGRARLRAQGEAARAPGRARARARTACSPASTTSSRSARWPPATGTSATRRC